VEILDFNRSKIPIEKMRFLEQVFGDDFTIAGLNDTFNFTCSRCNNCCKHCPGEGGFTIPHLLPYDIIRLSRSLKITTTKFLDRYAEFDQLDWPPLRTPFLKFIGDEREMRCPFLDDSGCSVHEDKPMICRFYPLGRFSLRTKALVTIPKRLKHCPGGSGQEHTVRNWLEESGVQDHFSHDKFWDLIFSMDIKSFDSLPPKCQDAFYTILYDIDRFFEGELLSNPAEEIVDFCYDFCERFLKEFDCLPDPKGNDDGENCL
jgi:Fe-S-cluster containining protein